MRYGLRSLQFLGGRLGPARNPNPLCRFKVPNPYLYIEGLMFPVLARSELTVRTAPSHKVHSRKEEYIHNVM